MKTGHSPRRQAEMRVRTGLASGNNDSDSCYFERNNYNLSLKCILEGRCYPEIALQTCLCIAGEPNWWKDFPGMSQERACQMTIDRTEGWMSPLKEDKLKQMGCA